MPRRAADFLLIYLRRPRRTELVELAIQVLLQGTHPGLSAPQRPDVHQSLETMTVMFR